MDTRLNFNKTFDHHKWDTQTETIKDARWNPIKRFDNRTVMY